ncbi:MAG: 1-deoxy-D-xylulose-5-phosphate synthase [Candidatus Cloacimonadota bacterium]|nr:MAG: 1-deoxy-D-xylulose-5-phosphate synthase [Candidatus Cloacimonadota bacterium]
MISEIKNIDNQVSIKTKESNLVKLNVKKSHQVLPNVNTSHDIKKLSLEQLNLLSEEIRDFLIHSISQTGGHLGPNLGTVEIILALHKVFDLPRDEIIFDVGHQCYVHKILTGRKSQFNTLRKYKGISGFTKRSESIFDSFTAGHGGPSISCALGKAIARDMKGANNHIVALIGDGALAEGMALEALNHLGHSQHPLIIILNDNEMSIAPNVGGYSKYLNRLRNEPHFRSSKDYFKHLVKDIPTYGEKLYHMMSKVKDSFKYLVTPGVIFEELGIRYVGPVDGHDLSALIPVLEEAKRTNKPIIVHVQTKKGKGFIPAEDTSPKGAIWHGGGPFDINKGCFIKASDDSPSYSKIFGQHLSRMAKEDPKVCAVTAAMPDGTGLVSFAQEFPDRFFDVSMAEQHAVGIGSGLAASNLKPFVAIYSTFIQRAYDQIMHDCCLQNLPVRFCMDRAGLVGADGPTHHGVFDISFLRGLPNIISMAPKDEQEFVTMLNTMKNHQAGPISIRYPRGSGTKEPVLNFDQTIKIGKAELLSEGDDLTIIAIGSMVIPAQRIAKILEQKLSIKISVINSRFIKPLDEKLILSQSKKSKCVITLEEGTIRGGFGSGILELLSENNLFIPSLKIGIPDEFIVQGSIDVLFKEIGLDDDSICSKVTSWLKEIK